MKKVVFTITAFLVFALLIAPAAMASIGGGENLNEDVRKEANEQVEKRAKEEFCQKGERGEHKLDRVKELEEAGVITEEEKDEIVGLIEEKNARECGQCLEDEDLEEVRLNMREYFQDEEYEGLGRNRGQHRK